LDDHDDAPSSKKNGKMSVTYKIAPKPAGGKEGQGEWQCQSGGFFFNPQPLREDMDEEF
jgi:hypothetical protein